MEKVDFKGYLYLSKKVDGKMRYKIATRDDAKSAIVTELNKYKIRAVKAKGMFDRMIAVAREDKLLDEETIKKIEES